MFVREGMETGVALAFGGGLDAFLQCVTTCQIYIEHGGTSIPFQSERVYVEPIHGMAGRSILRWGMSAMHAGNTDVAVDGQATTHPFHRYQY